MKIVHLTLAMLLLFAVNSLSQNTTSIIQTGDKQRANVTQTGTGNDAIIDQLNDGLGNQGGTDAIIQAADVVQSGADNIVTIDQDQTGDGDKYTNITYAEQTGSLNIINQQHIAPGYNSGQKTNAIQIGASNQITQTINTGYTMNLYAHQNGSMNMVTQYADGGSYDEAKVYQDGTSNQASQTLIGSNHGYWGGDVLDDVYGEEVYNGRVWIQQTGDNNLAVQEFYGGASGTSNNGIIEQVGNQNEGRQVVDGTQIKVETYQEGEENYATITIDGSENTAVQSQMGDFNYATILISGDLNDVGQSQAGDSNWAELDVTGTGNAVIQTQDDNWNDSNVLVTGDTNSAYTMQSGYLGTTGFMNDADISITGSGNTATITQTHMP